MIARRNTLISIVAIFCAATPVNAQTVTYKYDQQGRLIEATHAGGRNAGVKVKATFDPVDNRTQVVVEGQSRPPLIVLPLNGVTVIPRP